MSISLLKYFKLFFSCLFAHKFRRGSAVEAKERISPQIPLLSPYLNAGYVSRLHIHRNMAILLRSHALASARMLENFMLYARFYFFLNILSSADILDSFPHAAALVPSEMYYVDFRKMPVK